MPDKPKLLPYFIRPPVIWNAVVSADDAERLREEYEAKYPKLTNWWKQVKEKI